MTDDGATRERILDAARQVFSNRGTAGARTQEIADAAGVNKALIHYYFRTKDTLAQAVFQRELAALLQPVLKTLGSQLPLQDKVHTVIGLYLDKLSAFPQLPGYVLAETHFHPERLDEFFAAAVGSSPEAATAPVLQNLGRQIDQATAAGTMRSISPHQFMANLISLCVFPFAARPLLTRVTGGEKEFDAFLSERRTTLADFFLGGLRP